MRLIAWGQNMNNITDEQANLIVRQNLKYNKACTFNESGVHIDGDIWAFPINNKIFIGVQDYVMDEKTRVLVRRAMFLHNIAQKLKDNRTGIVVGGLALLSVVFMAIKSCSSDNRKPDKTVEAKMLEYAPKTNAFVKFLPRRTK